MAIIADSMGDVLQKSAGIYEPRGRLNPDGFERYINFYTYLPPDDLAPFIEHFWIIRWDLDEEIYYSEEVMHRPYVDIFVSPAQSGIQCTFRGKKTYVATGKGRIVGIRFRPGAFHAFWDGTLTQLQDKILDLKQVFPEITREYIEQVSALDDEAALHKLVLLARTKNPQPDANIELIHQIIIAIETNETIQTVTALAKAFGRSERWLQQFFQEYVGIGAKWLLQRYRLLAAAQQIRETEQPNWAAIAYDFGYSSQQHFITAFKEILGKTPLQYKEELAPKKD